MLITRIPRPISIIGDFTKKTISFASCNFTTTIDYNKNIEEQTSCSIWSKVLSCLQNTASLQKSSLIKNFESNDDFHKVYSSIFGGLNYLTTNNDLWFSIRLDYKKEFFEHLMIFEINKNFFEYKKETEKNLIKIDNLEKMVSDFYDSYQENNWVFLGQLINSYWKIKREIDPNSKNPYIERLYSDCRLNGAIGGKMDESLMILFVPKENQENIKRIMIDHTQINNSVDLNGLLYQEIFSGSSNCCK